ncbi:MAG: Glyoxalase/bleomycin resistance protein/dioxygenase [Rhodospirillales bacterium]|nr:Glyoxalase/bleomycin resistance protein/dioxygenase [Rhodospirillales bacterium]
MSHGSFVWYELMTTDTKAAKAFYGNVIGWGAQNADQPGMEYAMFTAGEIPVAGLMTLPEEARKAGGRPGWIGYVAVDDVDASAKQAAEAGGTVHRQPSDIPGVGRFAIIADPQGAVIALFKGSDAMQSPPPVAPKTPGHAGWRELMAVDGEAAFAFYSKLFGWTKDVPFDMGPMGLYHIFKVGDVQTGGMMTKPATVPAPFWGYYFYVDGIDAAVERVKAAGGQIVNGPHEVPGGEWIVQGLDLQGALFALLSTKR